MANYTFKDATGATKYHKATGTGTSGDPFVTVVDNEGLASDGSVAGATSQKQAFTAGITVDTSVLIADGATNDVQIGTTTNGGKLTVQGDGSNVVSLRNSVGTEIMVVDSSGNAGIGITPSKGKLHVNGSIVSGNPASIQTSGLSIKQSTNSILGGVLIEETGSTTNGGMYHTGSGLAFRENGANAIIISAGKVNMPALPTSSAGLSAGDLWNNSGVVNIV